MSRRPQRALLSVTDKTGLVPFAHGLARLGVQIVSTGGTAKALEAAGVPVVPLERFTGWPEMLDGRVKTLHPKVHAGLLARRELESHREEMARFQLEYIDLVAVNLYDFAGAVARSPALDEVLEAIDIGGPTLLRAAAKNHRSVTPVVRPADYPKVLEAIEAGGIDEPLSQALAAEVFAHTAAYDGAIAAYLSAGGEGAPARVVRSLEKVFDLRYGENGHQSAAFYRDPGAPTGLARAEVHQGKALSYNNLLDLDAALALSVDLSALGDQPNAVFIKHNNPCGAARADGLAEAIRSARAADPVSAFGAVVALSRPVDESSAIVLTEAFVEAVIAPSYSPEALAVFAAKKNLRALSFDEPWVPGPSAPVLRPVRGGMLRQDADTRPDPGTEIEQAKTVTARSPSDPDRRALAFAWVVAKHTKSNAIVFATEDRTVAVGAGQMSRIDAVELCRLKAGERLRGTAVASDAFFPFRDGLDALASAGAVAVAQPGGSVRDAEVVAAADEHGVAMVFTGVRHFRH